VLIPPAWGVILHMDRRLRTHEKFWRITVAEDGITLLTGPLGTPGVKSRIPAKSPEAAKKTAEALIAQRLKDGYFDDDGKGESSGQSPALGALEPLLLAGDANAWKVLADALLEAGDAVRGEFVVHQLRAQARVRGSIGKMQAYLKAHYDELVGPELAAFHKQVSIEWRNGYAHTVKVWSGPVSEPIAHALEAVFNSPACRYLRVLQLGSPGNEGRYGSTLRELAGLQWPKHLDALVLGAFDLNAAKRTDTTWPIIESLSALQPAPQLKELRIRAVLNTFGKGLSFPALERLWLLPSRVDGRLLSDLASIKAPKLRRFALTEDAVRSAPATALATALRQLISHPGIKELGLHGVRDLVPLLDLVGPDALAKLEELDVRESAKVSDAPQLKAIAMTLKQTRLEVGDAPTLAKKLEGHVPQLAAKPERPSVRAT